MPDDQTKSNTTDETPLTSSPDIEPATSATESTTNSTSSSSFSSDDDIQGTPLSDTEPVSSQTPAEPAQSSMPTPTPAPAFAPTPAPLTTKKGGKKKFVIGGIIAGVLVILGGGGALAYNFWYQNPDKVITDALANAITTKSTVVSGNVSIASKDVDVNITIDTKQSKDENTGLTANVKITPKSGELNGKSFEIKTDAVVAKAGDYYFKVNNLDKVVDVFLDSYIASYESSGFSLSESEKAAARAQFKQFTDPVVSKINNQWIKLSAADLAKDTSGSNTQKCLTDAANKLRDDKNAAKEFGDAYKNNRFIIVKKKLGSKDGSLGYELGFDKTKGKSFGDAAKNTAIGKALAACDTSTSSTSQSDADMFSSGKLEVWIDRWTHKITSVSFEATPKDDATTTFKGAFTTQYNKTEDVAIPSGAKSFDELDLGGVESLFGSSSSSSSSTESTSSYDYSSSYDSQI